MLFSKSGKTLCSLKPSLRHLNKEANDQKNIKNELYLFYKISLVKSNTYQYTYQYLTTHINI